MMTRDHNRKAAVRAYMARHPGMKYTEANRIVSALIRNEVCIHNVRINRECSDCNAMVQR